MASEPKLTMIERKGRLLSLPERVSPEHTALLVIDIQNDFCHEEGIFGKLGYDTTWMDPMVEKVRALITEARRRNVLTIFFRGYEDAKYLNIPMAETYNRRGFKDSMVCKDTWGADWYLDLRPIDTPSETHFAKHRFSAFRDTPLHLYLRSNGIKTVMTTGVVTSGCVESSARDAFSEGYAVVVPRDCVADAVEERHKASLSKLAQAFGEVVTSEEIMESWRQTNVTRRQWQKETKAARQLDGLASQLAPGHTALVLVDMQKDLTDADGVLAKSGEDLTAVKAAVANAAKLLAAARKAGVTVIHVATERSNLSESDAAIARGGRLDNCCRAGTAGAEVTEALKPKTDEEIVIKHRSGAFSDTRLELLLRSNSLRSVIVAGVGASGAVDTTVREASDKDFYVVVAADGVASPGARADLDRASLDNMAANFAQVAPTARIVELWQR